MSDLETRLETVQTFEEMADVALEILDTMSEEGKQIVEICGPISTGGLGDINLNLQRLERAIGVAIERGMYVFNQAPFENAIKRVSSNYQKNEDGYCMEILEIFYRKIFESGHIKLALFLPDWQSSKGANWEMQTALRLGIETRDFPIEWLS